MPYAAIWRKPSTATPTSWDSTTQAASRGETILRATVDATQTTSMRTKAWLKAAPSASGRRCPARRAVTIWMPSTSASGATRKIKSIESATAIAPSAVTPTRARKIVSITWRTASLVCAKMIGSEIPQTTRESLSAVIPTSAVLPQAGRCPVVSRGEDERVGVSIEVHHHARQQGAALVKLAEIEIADLEGEVRRNVLQLAVLVDLPLVVLRSELEVVNVRRVQNRLWQANGVADARITVVDGDIDDVRDFLDLCDRVLLEQLGADQGVLLRDREDQAVEVVEVRIDQPDLDDSHVEGRFHPVVGLALGSNTIPSHVQVVVEVLQLGLPFELRRREVNLVAHVSEELRSHLRLAPTGLRREVRDDDRVLVGEVLEDDPQIRGEHEILKIGAAGRGELVDQGLGGEIAVQLEKLDGGSLEVRHAPVGGQILHPGIVGDPGRVREREAQKKGRAIELGRIQPRRGWHRFGEAGFACHLAHLDSYLVHGVVSCGWLRLLQRSVRELDDRVDPRLHMVARLLNQLEGELGRQRNDQVDVRAIAAL